MTKPSQNNIQKLKEWVEQVQLDPNDPNNADLFEYLKVRSFFFYFFLTFPVMFL